MGKKRKASGGPVKSSKARFRTEDGQMVELDAAEDEFGVDDGREEDLFGGELEDSEDDEMQVDGEDEDSSSSEEEDSEEDDEEEEEEEDDGEEEDEEEEDLLRWGSSRHDLYGGDTADIEIGQDVADAEEEEALGEVLRRRQLEALDARDFALEGDDEAQVETLDKETPSGLFGEMMAALQGDKTAPVECTAGAVLKERLQKAADALKALGHVTASGKQQESAAARAKRVAAVLKEQLLLCLCYNLGFAGLLAAQGKDPTAHPVVARVASLTRRIQRLDRDLQDVQLPESDDDDQSVDDRSDDGSDVDLRPDEKDHGRIDGGGDDGQDDDEDSSDDEDRAMEALPATVATRALDRRLVKQAKRAAKRVLDEGPSGDADADRRRIPDSDSDSEDQHAPADDKAAADDDDDESAGSDPPLDDDERKFLELYEKQAAARTRKKKEKADKYTPAERYGAWTAQAPPAAALDDGRRAANREIIENRGLAPRKSKINRNPRLVRRLKYKKAVIRRKGQVRDTIPEGTDTVNYGGETTGIRSSLSRSRRVLASKR